MEDTDMGMLLKDLPDQEQTMIMAKDREIMALVRQLGGNSRAYHRERMKTLKPMLAEVYSTARVTAVTKMLPNLGIIPASHVTSA